MKDRIANLKKFIENNLEEKDGGHWEYLIDPIIKNAISDFNKKESENFATEFLNWDEKIIFHLADGIILSENEYINKDYLYCIIFSKTSDSENGEYLLENFMAAFQGLDSTKCSLEFLKSLRKKVIEFSKISINESHAFNKLYEEKVTEILEK